MNKPINQLLQKEVTRREFLTLSGFGLASLLGFSTLIHLFTGRGSSNGFTHRTEGYGSSAYGGSKD